MSLPTSEPIPPQDAKASLPPPAVRRRRDRRVVIPASSEGQAAFLEDLARRVTPSFDFFLFTVLSGLALAIAILVDSPAFFVLAALLAPFMGPVVGMAFSTILGSPRFVFRMLGALLVGSLIVFAWGVLTGWVARLWPGLVFSQVASHAAFAWADMLLVALGAGLTTFTLVRSPQVRPLVTSVALAYELYLPAGVAGFGLTSGLQGLWPQGLLVYLLHLALATLVGSIVLIALGMRPLTPFGYGLGAVLTTACLAALAVAGSQGMVLLPQMALPVAIPTAATPAAAIPEPTVLSSIAVPSGDAIATPFGSAEASPFGSASATTPAPSRTPTNTLIPSGTPTASITPAPTPVWAYIHSGEGGGAIIRESPSFQAAWAKSLLNGMLVQMLPDTVEAEGTTWVKVRTAQGLEGWIVRSLLTTATPAPAS